MNDLKTIRQLIKMMVENDLSEIDLEGDGEKIKLKRGTPGGGNAGGGVQYVPAPAAAAAPAPAAAAALASEGGADDAGHDDADLITIDSPMVGTFYTASNPDADAFVHDGDSVKPDTVVCIIEAMKVFNEIKAEVSGQIVEVLVKNGDAVEFGQPLYKIKP
ncbi:MAG: acetyl-CoA carboxylase biotin carboxyl carrier protein [Planctomycetota bacterium]